MLALSQAAVLLIDNRADLSLSAPVKCVTDRNSEVVFTRAVFADLACRIAIDLTNHSRGMHRATESLAAQTQSMFGRSNTAAPEAIVFSIGEEKGERSLPCDNSADSIVLLQMFRFRRGFKTKPNSTRSKFAVRPVCKLQSVDNWCCRAVKALLGLFPAKRQVNTVSKFVGLIRCAQN